MVVMSSLKSGQLASSVVFVDKEPVDHSGE